MYQARLPAISSFYFSCSILRYKHSLERKSWSLEVRVRVRMPGFISYSSSHQVHLMLSTCVDMQEVSGHFKNTIGKNP